MGTETVCQQGVPTGGANISQGFSGKGHWAERGYYDACSAAVLHAVLLTKGPIDAPLTPFFAAACSLAASSISLRWMTVSTWTCSKHTSSRHSSQSMRSFR
jgi:hypothetical protein